MADDRLNDDSKDHVQDDELLYRGVRRKYWVETAEGFRLSKQAFTEPEYKISVNRAALCDCDPSSVQEDSTCFVRRILAERIRSISNVGKYHNTEQVTGHAIDVHPAPLETNDAHAEIVANPEINNEKIFRRLQASLVRVSEWEDGYKPRGT